MVQQTVRSGVRHWPYVMAGVVIGAALVLTWPVAIPVLGVGLIVGGVTGYRQTREPMGRAVAAGAAAAGIMIMIGFVLVGLMLVGVRTETGVSDAVPVTPGVP